MTAKNSGTAAYSRAIGRSLERCLPNRCQSDGGPSGFGAVGSLLHYLQHGNGDLLFHSVLASLIVSQIAEYAFQIALLRRSA